MYRMLIVDDEIPAVHALQCALDWESLGISEIHTAFNALQARRLLTYKPVDIMICDIQMPGEDGMSLMHWVKERYPDTQFIFLTVHDNSRYIRSAIHSGCLDYLLKPVDLDELEQAIHHATAHLQDMEKLQEYDAMRQQFEHNASGIYIRFWQDYFAGRIPANAAAIMEEADRRGIIFKDQGILERFHFFPVLLAFKEWQEWLDTQEKQRLTFAIRNMAEESMIEAGCMGQFFAMGEGLLGGCFMIPGDASLDQQGLPAVFDRIHAICRDFFSCRVQVFLADCVEITKLPTSVQELLAWQRSAVSDEAWLWYHDKAYAPHVEELKEQPDIAAWGILIKENQRDQLGAEITDYLRRMNSLGELNVSQLYQFRQLFAALCYDTLKLRRLLTWDVLTDRQMLEMEDRARHSVEGTVAWCLMLLTQVRQMKAADESSKPLVEQIKDHIANNLDAALSREELAKVFYINRDHLGRLFKKETGTGLSAYIQEERMRRACFLLENTDIPVGDVGAQVGMLNFSYFCKCFREQLHMSPQSYRKQHKHKETDHADHT